MKNEWFSSFLKFSKNKWQFLVRHFKKAQRVAPPYKDPLKSFKAILKVLLCYPGISLNILLSFVSNFPVFLINIFFPTTLEQGQSTLRIPHGQVDISVLYDQSENVFDDSTTREWGERTSALTPSAHSLSWLRRIS